MGLNVFHFRELVVRPCLAALEPLIPYSDVATELLMLTAATESHMGEFMKQLNGPALGPYQMEPATHRDIWKNFLVYHQVNIDEVTTRVGWKITQPQDRWLFSNLDYATVLARLKYRMSTTPFPTRKDPETLAQYWKLVWNTPLGKGTVAKAVSDYQRYVLDAKISA